MCSLPMRHKDNCPCNISIQCKAAAVTRSASRPIKPPSAQSIAHAGTVSSRILASLKMVIKQATLKEPQLPQARSMLLPGRGVTAQ